MKYQIPIKLIVSTTPEGTKIRINNRDRSQETRTTIIKNPNFQKFGVYADVSDNDDGLPVTYSNIKIVRLNNLEYCTKKEQWFSCGLVFIQHRGSYRHSGGRRGKSFVTGNGIGVSRSGRTQGSGHNTGRKKGQRGTKRGGIRPINKGFRSPLDNPAYMLAQSIPRTCHMWMLNIPANRVQLASSVHGLWVMSVVHEAPQNQQSYTQARNMLENTTLEAELHQVWRNLRKNSKRGSRSFWVSQFNKHGGNYMSFLDYLRHVKRLEARYRASDMVMAAIADITMEERNTHFYDGYEWNEIELGQLHSFLTRYIGASPLLKFHYNRTTQRHYLEEIRIVFDKYLTRPLDITGFRSSWAEGSLSSSDATMKVWI